VPSLLPETAYRGRVWETGAGARTAPAAALRAAVSRSFQTTPCRPLVRPAVDVIAPPLVICSKVKQLSPRVWEATLPCDVPELSGDLPVMFTVRILPPAGNPLSGGGAGASRSGDVQHSRTELAPTASAIAWTKTGFLMII
jgi:hypothetical protein